MFFNLPIVKILHSVKSWKKPFTRYHKQQKHIQVAYPIKLNDCFEKTLKTLSFKNYPGAQKIS